jgi:hypothetical protein
VVEKDDLCGWCGIVDARSYFVIGSLDDKCEEDGVKVPNKMITLSRTLFGVQ